VRLAEIRWIRFVWRQVGDNHLVKEEAGNPARPVRGRAGSRACRQLHRDLRSYGERVALRADGAGSGVAMSLPRQSRRPLASFRT
jgi:hypothetical protein